MRRLIHRLLTGFPTLAVAILGLLAAANPTSAKTHLARFVTLMGDNRLLWLCILAVISYFSLWWITSLEPRSLADRLRRKGLFAMYDEMQSISNKLKAQKWSESETQELISKAEVTHQKIQNWIRNNIGEAAVSSYQSGTRKLAYSGSGEAYNFSLTLDLYISNLQELSKRPDEWHSIKRAWWKPWDHVEQYE